MEEPIMSKPEGTGGEGGKTPDRTVKIAIWALIGLIAAAVVFFALTVGIGLKTSQPATVQPDGQTGTPEEPNSADNTRSNYALTEYRNKVLGLTIDKTIGAYFTEPDSGMTLYVLKAGSECTGACLKNWKPYDAPAEITDGQLSVFARSDSGELQYAWQGRGLYTYVGDERPGDVLGDGFDSSSWTIARPQM